MIQRNLFENKKVKRAVSSESISSTTVLELFYSKLSEKFPVITNELGKLSHHIDEKAINRFVKKVQATGAKKSDALEIIKSYIELYFKYFDSLGLREPVLSLEALLSRNFSWIAKKVAVIHARALLEYEDSEEVEQLKLNIYNTSDDITKRMQQKRHEELLNLYIKEKETDGKKS